MTPVVINNAEVLSINCSEKTFSIVVHVHTLPAEMYNPQTQDFVMRSVQKATKYLMAEGFLPERLDDEWIIQISGICHPPKT